MKILKTTFFTLLFSTAFTFLLSTTFISCSKDKENTSNTFSIEGTWTGKTGNGGQFGIHIKSGGVLERFGASGTVSATGTWQINGNTLNGTYDFATGTHVVMTATVDKSNNSLTGTWVNDAGEQGTMFAEKAK
jgi:hypothetical protein